jgi:hypothetical protein
MNKELKYASMHTPAFIPNVGQFGPTVEVTGRVKKMTENGNNLEFELTDKNGKAVTAGIPKSQFILWVYKDSNGPSTQA